MFSLRAQVEERTNRKEQRERKKKEKLVLKFKK